MPELPEVETVRRGLAPAMDGAEFESVLLRRADLRFPFPSDFADRLTGATAGKLGRRGKYLTLPLSTGETLIMHLGMTGRFTAASTGDAALPGRSYQGTGPLAPHDHVEFTMRGQKGGFRITYNDPRRFGFMDLAPTKKLEESKHLEKMGPEPLGPEFNSDLLRSAFAGRTGPVKTVLLDQSVVAGLGNIYACEALFRAGVSPTRKASRLSAGKISDLHTAIGAVLTEAINAGGSTLRDFAASDGSLGYFQHRFSVYDREGRACPRCSSKVRRIVQSGRSTFYCGKCQR